MKKYFAIAILFLSSFAGKAQVISVPVVYQEHDQWCWAGCSNCIFKYFGFTWQQCDIAEYTRTVATWHSFGSTNCCTNPLLGCNYWNYMSGSAGSITDILSHFNSITSHTTGVLTLAEMRTEATKTRPTVLHWSWYGGGGHFVIGSGADASDNVHYMNPWVGEGAHISTYSWMMDDGSHIYNSTIVLDVCPSLNPGVITGAVSSVCIGGTLTLSDATPGGVWSSTTGRCLVSSGVVTAIGGGKDTIKYTLTNPCGSFSATKIITINPDPGTIVGGSTVCTGKQLNLSNATTGGTWSTSKSKATITAAGVVKGITAGIDTVFYSISSTCGVSKAKLVLDVADCHLAAGTVNATDASLQVFPNPTDGTFIVKLNSALDVPVTLVITNLVGRKVMEVNAITNHDSKITLDEPSGIYLLTASTEQERYVTKVMLTR